MGRRALVALHRIYTIEKSHQYVHIVKSGRSWAPKIQPAGKPGAYYLRYQKNGRRTFESVGDDLQLALQERKARDNGLSSPALRTVLPSKKFLRDAMGEFLADKEPKNWRHILRTFGAWWGWEKDPANFQRTDFKAFARHVETLDLRPRTRKNYLSNLTTFLRGTGRVVLVARNEQDATKIPFGSVEKVCRILHRSREPLWFPHALLRDGLWTMGMYRVRWRLYADGWSIVANVGTALQRN